MVAEWRRTLLPSGSQRSQPQPTACAAGALRTATGEWVRVWDPRRSLFARLPVGDYVSGTLVGWEFDAPAGTEIVGYRISRSTTVGAPSAAGAAPAY